MSLRVLVTDGDQRSALAVVRSLGRAGYQVHVAAARAGSLAAASRYCAVEHTVSDALQHPEKFAAQLRAIAVRRGMDVLLPITEAAVAAVLDLGGWSERGICVPFASHAAFKSICDKEQVLLAADRLGINTPQQLVVRTRDHLDDAALRGLTFPVVIKPHRSVLAQGSGAAKLSVAHAANLEELQARIATLPGTAFPLLLQQRVSGRGQGIFLLMWDGEVRAAFAHTRLREKPPSGGVSVYSESVAADPRLVARAADLLRHFNWRGVAMVEFKGSGNNPYLMEVNGRFWGSLQLAVDAGVDFPRLLVEAGIGRAAAHLPSYRLGARTRWWWGDVDQALTRLRRPRAQLALTKDHPGRLRAVLDVPAVWLTSSRSEVLRRDDIRPFFRETANWLRGR